MRNVHYFVPSRSFTDEEWSQIVDMTKRAIAACNLWEIKVGIPFLVEAGANPDEVLEMLEEGDIINSAIIDISDPEMMYEHGFSSPTQAIGFCGEDIEENEDFFLYKDIPEAGVSALPDYQTYGSIDTDQLNYGVLVTAILSAINKIAPGALNISTDGDISEWESGVGLLNSIGFECEVPESLSFLASLDMEQSRMLIHAHRSPSPNYYTIQ